MFAVKKNPDLWSARIEKGMELRIIDDVSEAISLQSHPGSLSDVVIEGIKNDIYNSLSLDLEKNG